MATLDEIKKLKEYYTKDLYTQVRKEQKTDEEYRLDTFLVDVRDPHIPVRDGLGARMVDAPAEQIITSNPQAFVEILKGPKDAEERISKVINGWIQVLKRQNPNPFKESVKNKLARGENYIKLVHNEAIGLPVLFPILDPMVIYSSPEEDDNGIPHKVIVFYERQPADVIVMHPNWTNPKHAGIGENINKRVTWFEYWDSETRYFEADDEAILKGDVQKNIYGFPPFIRKYSGFGRRSFDGKLEELIVSDLRHNRDLIREDCIMRSDISSVLHLFAHKPKMVTSPGQLNRKDFEDIQWGAYDVVALSNMPPGTKIELPDVPLPTAELLQHFANNRAELNQRNPFLMAGFPIGASGRQQDMSSMAAMRRYDTVIENTEIEWATAFEKAFAIMKSVPKFPLPKGLGKSDLDIIFRCSVKLKAKDPVEEDNLVTLGDRLWAQGNGSIDLETFHTQFQGRTVEESKKIKAKMLVDKLTLYNPDVAAVMGMVFAEESGMDKWLEMAQQRRAQMEQQQKGLQEMPAPTTMERIQGEVRTPLGREMMDMALANRGARQSPERFTRGQ